ncbi:hypothetical protein [Burkholderia phage BgVeeders33]|nr:hypothetical protein [Burkholderia phage BgVeeders33]
MTARLDPSSQRQCCDGRTINRMVYVLSTPFGVCFAFYRVNPNRQIARPTNAVYGVVLSRFVRGTGARQK